MKFYFTGAPCVRGHIAERYTKSRMCVACAALAAQEARKRNPEAGRLATRRYRENNPERAASLAKQWASSNPEKAKAARDKFAAANPGKMRAKWSARRARKLNATPAWDGELTDFVAREAFYLAAMRECATGIAWHVDHMIPLRARRVSGLHVWNNLQVIPESMNIAKLNRVVLTAPGEWVRYV